MWDLCFDGLCGRRAQPPPRSLARSLTHSLTRSLTHSLARSLTHSLARSLTHSLTHSLACSLARSYMQICMYFVRMLCVCVYISLYTACMHNIHICVYTCMTHPCAQLAACSKERWVVSEIYPREEEMSARTLLNIWAHAECFSFSVGGTQVEHSVSSLRMCRWINLKKHCFSLAS